jgi:magnesium-transporting ATPase (P-type)
LAYEAMIDSGPTPTTRQEIGGSNAPAAASGSGERPETSFTGLSQAEAKQRLAQYGFNELPEKKVNAVLKFLSYF